LVDLTSLALTAALLAKTPADAAPATRSPCAYAYASGYVSYHAANGPLYHRVSPAVGGGGADVAFGAGAFVARHLAVEGEILRGGAVSRPQHYSYLDFEDYVEHTHDVLISALARVNMAGSAVQVSGGISLARTTTQETSVVRTDYFAGISMPQDRTPNTVNAIGWTAGVDVRAWSRAHFVLAPSFRIRWIQREMMNAPASTGISRLTWQFGMTAFVR
jgi:hypothetical protein